MIVDQITAEAIFQITLEAGLAEKRSLLLTVFGASMRATLPVLQAGQPQDQLRKDIFTLNKRKALHTEPRAAI